MLLACGTVIIVVLLSIDPVGLAGHATAAAAADQNAGEQVYRVLLRGGTGVQSPDSLNKIEVLFGYQGFMGIGNANPFRFRLLLQLLDFIVGGALPALNQCAGVGFILQNADDGGSRPLAVLAVGIAILGVGQAVIFLIGQWRENTQPVQLVGNPQGTGASRI